MEHSPDPPGSPPPVGSLLFETRCTIPKFISDLGSTINAARSNPVLYQAFKFCESQIIGAALFNQVDPGVLLEA